MERTVFGGHLLAQCKSKQVKVSKNKLPSVASIQREPFKTAARVHTKSIYSVLLSRVLALMHPFVVSTAVVLLSFRCLFCIPSVL